MIMKKLSADLIMTVLAVFLGVYAILYYLQTIVELLCLAIVCGVVGLYGVGIKTLFQESPKMGFLLVGAILVGAILIYRPL